MKPAASCKKVPTSKARSASCARPTASSSPRPGARKLAHYVEREVTRLLASRSGPIAVPIEPATPEANVAPGQPAPRPLAGPVMPLVASSVGTDQLLGGPGSRPAAVDALAARTLVKGEALAPPAGRADDYAWPPPGDRPRAGQGRYAGGGRIAGRNGGGSARTEAAFTPAAAANVATTEEAAASRNSRCSFGQRKTTGRRCAISSAGSARRRVSPRRLRPHRRADRWPRARRARLVMSDDRPRFRRATSRDSEA